MEPVQLERHVALNEAEETDNRNKTIGRRENRNSTAITKDWWTDNRTAFREFASDLAKVKSVGGALGKPDENNILRQPPRILDVLGWRL